MHIDHDLSAESPEVAHAMLHFWTILARERARECRQRATLPPMDLRIPERDLRALVSSLAWTDPTWRLERTEELRHGGPWVRFRVLHGTTVVAEAESVVIELAAGECYRQVQGRAK